MSTDVSMSQESESASQAPSEPRTSLPTNLTVPPRNREVPSLSGGEDISQTQLTTEVEIRQSTNPNQQDNLNSIPTILGQPQTTRRKSQIEAEEHESELDDTMEQMELSDDRENLGPRDVLFKPTGAFWSAREARRLHDLVDEHMNRMAIDSPHGVKGFWKGVSEEFEELGFKRSEKACRTYWVKMQDKPQLEERDPVSFSIKKGKNQERYAEDGESSVANQDISSTQEEPEITNLHLRIGGLNYSDPEYLTKLYGAKQSCKSLVPLTIGPDRNCDPVTESAPMGYDRMTNKQPDTVTRTKPRLTRLSSIQPSMIPRDTVMDKIARLKGDVEQVKMDKEDEERSRRRCDSDMEKLQSQMKDFQNRITEAAIRKGLHEGKIRHHEEIIEGKKDQIITLELVVAFLPED